VSIIKLSAVDLGIAAALVLLLAVTTARISARLAGQLVIAGVRTVIQLLLIGLVLKYLFENSHPVWVGCLTLVMLLVAGYEVMSRQHRRFTGLWGYNIGLLSMFVSSYSVTLFALWVIIGNKPWYQPQYAIPLLGMMLGNTMNGVALALDRLTQMTWDQRGRIEAQLLLGHTPTQAMMGIKQQVFRSGLIPIVNAMAAAGIVSLPGMMTGQILAGTPPVEAVKYQILIMFLISTGAGFGTLAALHVATRRLFDDRQRLRLDRTKSDL